MMKSRRTAWLFFVLILLSVLPALAEEEPLPCPVQNMLDIALGELTELNREKIPRTNKYSRWYFNDERRIGWCVTFAGWCADEAGMPMVKEADAAADYPRDELFFPMEAKVVLASRAFENAGRLTDVPRPGYAVIYGVIGSTPYTHFALVETVTELEDGTYEITTLEGNVGNTVKRYCFRYNPHPSRKHHNMKAVPEAQRVREDAQYKLHQENWFISGFGRTY